MNGRLSGQTAAACLRAAVAAPSIHNTQPWRFLAGDDGFDVFTDPQRALEVIDPQRRALHISVGAAVCNLRIALAAEGWTSRLTPGEASGELVARITLGPHRDPATGVRVLAGAIARRRTNREPFRDVVVPADTLDLLRHAVGSAGVRLQVLDPVRRGAVLALTQSADARQQADPAYRGELAAWTTAGDDRRDGVPARVFGPRAAISALPLRDFGLELRTLQRDAACFERHPLVLVLHSRGDDRAAWLETGRCLERLLLTATVHGLAAQPMTQALEVPGFRRALAEPSGRWYPQMILRVGYGRPVGAAGRRPVHDALVTHPGSPALPRSTTFSRPTMRAAAGPSYRR